MFESKTVVGHLVRGAIGFGALGCAIAMGQSHPWVMLAAVPVALLALRGCPMCWTVGLVQTVGARIRGRSTEGLCGDGSCALVRPPAQADPRGVPKRAS